jgi:hypothetical protein
MRLLRVEVWLGGELLEARTFANLIMARTFAEHRRAHGFCALVMYPRAEPWHDSRYRPSIQEGRHEANAAS